MTPLSQRAGRFSTPTTVGSGGSADAVRELVSRAVTHHNRRKVAHVRSSDLDLSDDVIIRALVDFLRLDNFSALEVPDHVYTVYV